MPALWVCTLICRRQLGGALCAARRRRRLRRRHVALHPRQLCLPLLQLGQQRPVVHKWRHGRHLERLLHQLLHGAAHVAVCWRAVERKRCAQGSERRIARRLSLGQRRLQQQEAAKRRR